MYCCFTIVDLQTHLCKTVNTGHKETSYLFQQYFNIWKDEFERMKQFTIEILHEEKDPERPDFVDNFHANNGSTFDCIDYQLGVITELHDKEKQMVCKDLYDAPVLTNQDQKNMHMYRHRDAFRNPYSLATLKHNIDSLIEQQSTSRSCSEIESKSVVSLNTSAYDCLAEYFDDDEISVLNRMNLLSNFTKEKWTTTYF